MLAKNPRTTPRSLEEVALLIEIYPLEWRRWCDGPERGGCACMGCVRQPAPSTVRGDPEYREWSDERNALIKEEVEMYLATVGNS